MDFSFVGDALPRRPATIAPYVRDLVIGLHAVLTYIPSRPCRSNKPPDSNSRPNGYGGTLFQIPSYHEVGLPVLPPWHLMFISIIRSMGIVDIDP